jgi:5-hydroxyisourate hydrolase
MPGVSIHVVDVSRGVVATGMKIELFMLAPERRLFASGVVTESGLLDEPRLGQRFERGAYEAVFHVAAWYRVQGVPLPHQPFLESVVYGFGIDDPAQHYHLPFKCTPWGYSCFRGGN